MNFNTPRFHILRTLPDSSTCIILANVGRAMAETLARLMAATTEVEGAVFTVEAGQGTRIAAGE